MKRSLIFILLYAFAAFAQTEAPKREVRAAWVATVANLDWPSSRWAGSQTQKNELISILNKLQLVGINTIVFQIRTECDALYNSPYEPWSYWLTGQQGKAPNPLYDPLEFACTEAHKRNMELHAWFNPYRAEKTVGSYAIASTHVTKQHPDWDLQIGNFKFLNPGLPEVRAYVGKIVTDVVKRYDIDGVHFDDYFYPYPPNNITTEDAATFSNYSRGIIDITDWRRDNVNLLVEAVYDSINTWKPWVKFGISPFGIWKYNVPEGIVGISSYNDIYCDPLAWLEGEYIDYVNPQLYWKITGPQDYSLLMPWWGSVSNDRHIYAGHALYKMTGSNNWPATEIGNQIDLNRAEGNVQGNVFFRSDNIIYNTKGIADLIANEYYQYPVLVPSMPWKDSVPPENPQMLTAKILEQGIELEWDHPVSASDGDTAKWFVVYRFTEQDSINPDNTEKILAILDSKTPYYLDENTVPETEYTYLVTALDKLKNESQPSNQLQIVFTDIEAEIAILPEKFKLQQNYPNPFNPFTTIAYGITASGFVDLSIYNILGQKVATLVSDIQPAGEFKIKWDGSEFAGGVYLYTLRTAEYSETRKMVLVK